MLAKESGGIGNLKSWDHIDHSIVKIDENTLMSSGDPENKVYPVLGLGLKSLS